MPDTGPVDRFGVPEITKADPLPGQVPLGRVADIVTAAMSGLCSRHQHGQDPECRICYPVSGAVPAAAEAADSQAIRQQILDRCETSQQSQWIRAAYDLGHADGAAQATTAERERIIGMLWAEVTKNRDSEADFAHCAISAGALEDFAALLDAGAES